MLFDNYTYSILLLVLSALYVAAITYLQGNVGGKGRLKQLYADMTGIQKRMIESSKKGDDLGYNEAVSQNLKLNFELMKLQFQMTGVILVVLLGLGTFVFPHIEPGFSDDATIVLYDDGLSSHCDAASSDSIYSSCYTLPPNAQEGAWIVDGYLNSSSGEMLSRGSAAIFLRTGKPTDVWLQSFTQNGWIDKLLGKKSYVLNVSTGKSIYSAGEAVAISAAAREHLFDAANTPSALLSAFTDAKINLSEQDYQKMSEFSNSNAAESVIAVGGEGYHFAKQSGLLGESVSVYSNRAPQGAKASATLNAGTFFHVDLPFALPLLNISRISGSYGAFIFFAFVLGAALSIAKAAYSKLSKK